MWALCRPTKEQLKDVEYEHMEVLQELNISCPYCGETIAIMVESSLEEQQYIEDCQVCCKPMVICVQPSANGQSVVEARGEDDA